MKILAIDPGKVRIGFAISDPDRKFAFPLANYTRGSLEQDERAVRRIVEEERPATLLVGLPMHTTGREGAEARKARELGALLEKWTGLPVIFWDERFTSKDAESLLWDAGLTHKQRKARRDQLAAQILLESYLAAGCPPDWKEYET